MPEAGNGIGRHFGDNFIDQFPEVANQVASLHVAADAFAVEYFALPGHGFRQIAGQGSSRAGKQVDDEDALAGRTAAFHH